tara:strand:+ start:273 stop:464 length:192 start_codon:yes stop_codon:yes gene_type:complete
MKRKKYLVTRINSTPVVVYLRNNDKLQTIDSSLIRDMELYLSRRDELVLKRQDYLKLIGGIIQ